MASPDYKALTAEFKHIIVTLEAGVLTILLNRAKEYVAHWQLCCAA
jgi:hypothetical protein